MHYYRPTKKPLTPQQLLKFCKDIATGMRHLAKKEFVHRDLAARNIMLDEKLVCKVCPLIINGLIIPSVTH